MNLPSIEDVEKSVGGRPKMDNPKVRMSFYLQPEEAEKLKLQADKQGVSTSAYCKRASW